MFNFNSKIVLCGGAGLVGQNLVHILIESGYTNITVIDKHERNLQILKNYYLRFRYGSNFIGNIR